MLLSRMQKEEISVTLGLWWSRTLFISQSLSLHYLSIHRISSAPRQFFESLGDCNTTLSVKPLYHHHRHVHREAIALTRTTTTTMRPAMGVVLFALLAHASNTTRTPQHHHHLTHNRSRQDEEDIDQGGGGHDKPTKYHYYPHNQHLYLLPECATQQVCSAVYLRLNYSQPLCACPSGAKPCSVSTRTDDRHTIPLVTGTSSQVLTLVKTCEASGEVRECNKAKDWSILALQNSRTGKAHYLVICRCPAPGYLEGPVAHSQPAYARVPGIRVYGMTCIREPERSGRLDPPWTSPTPPTHSQLPRGAPWGRLKALLHNLLQHVQ